MVHAKGSGAYGSFTVTHDIRHFTKAALFSKLGKQTPVFLRFSTVGGEKGPQWDVKLQVASEQQLAEWSRRTGWNPFDLTKVWPHGDFPLLPVGVLELNRNPANYHAEVEQAAFSPANVVPGMGYSPDKMLQGRLFAYHDAQLYRVGTSHQHLPVNAPRRPFRNHQRDGAMAIANGGAARNYHTLDAAGRGARWMRRSWSGSWGISTRRIRHMGAECGPR